MKRNIFEGLLRGLGTNFLQTRTRRRPAAFLNFQAGLLACLALALGAHSASAENTIELSPSSNAAETSIKIGVPTLKRL